MEEKSKESEEKFEKSSKYYTTPPINQKWNGPSVYIRQKIGEKGVKERQK